MRLRTGRTEILAGALVLVGIAAGCGDRDAVPAELSRRPATPVRAETVEASHLASSLTVSGIVEAQSRIELGFRVGGFVERFHVDEGDRVEAGALLAELDREDLARDERMARAAVARAAAEAERTALDFERQQQLFAARSTSQQRLDQTRTARDVARARLTEGRLALEAARDRLEKAELRAPISGYIEERRLEPHERAAAEAPVLVLSALDTVTVRAAVAGASVSLLEVGSSAVVRLGDRALEGSITRVAVAADATTRTVPFEVEVANPDLALRPQTVVTVEIHRVDDVPAYAVPIASVLRGVDHVPFCFVVVGEEGAIRVERRTVDLGAMFRDRVTVLKGLAAGDRVVTRGQHFLQEGDPVLLIGAPPP